MNPPAPRSRPTGAAGFTLLELMLVLVILAVLVGLMIPRLRDRSQQELESHAKRLIMTFRLLRSEAILHEASYRLNFDLDGERYWITASDRRANLDNIVTELGSLARRTQLPELVEIRDIALPMHDVKANQGEIYTEFHPDGTVEPTVIHLATDRTAMTLYVNPMNNRLIMQPGYHEIPYN